MKFKTKVLHTKAAQTASKLIPALMPLFLLSFVWSKSWSLVNGLFYVMMLLSLFTITHFNPRALRTHWPLWLFLGWFSISALWSPSVRMEDLSDVLRYSLCIGFLPLIFSTPARDKLSWSWLPIIAAVPILVAMCIFFSQHPFYERLEHFGCNPIPSGGLYAFFGVLAIKHLKPKDSAPDWKIRTSIVVLITALFLTQSKSPILGFFAGGAVFFGFSWFNSTSRRLEKKYYIRILSVFFLILIAGIGGIARSSDFLPVDKSRLFLSDLTTYRSDIWISTLKQMPNHWIYGHGLFAPYTWLAEDFAVYNLPRPMEHLHSLIFWALFHGGIIGLGITLVLAGAAVWRAFRHALTSGNTLPLALISFGLFCCIFGGNKYLYRPRGEWIIFWIPICYALTCRRTGQEARVGGQRTEDGELRAE